MKAKLLAAIAQRSCALVTSVLAFLKKRHNIGVALGSAICLTIFCQSPKAEANTIVLNESVTVLVSGQDPSGGGIAVALDFNFDPIPGVSSAFDAWASVGGVEVSVDEGTECPAGPTSCYFAYEYDDHARNSFAIPQDEVPTTFQVSFQEFGTGSAQLVISSNYELSATPLPAALPLFASGLGALGLLGRRRKRKNAALAA